LQLVDVIELAGIEGRWAHQAAQEALTLDEEWLQRLPDFGLPNLYASFLPSSREFLCGSDSVQSPISARPAVAA